MEGEKLISQLTNSPIHQLFSRYKKNMKKIDKIIKKQ